MYRLCVKQTLLAGFKVIIASNEYLARHNRTLMILAFFTRERSTTCWKRTQNGTRKIGKEDMFWKVPKKT